MATVKNGYVNGSDVLLQFAGKAFGHCTSHTSTFTSETKERAVKPKASALIGAGLWKDASVVGLSIEVKAEGLRFYNEDENGFKELFAKWKAGAPVDLDLFERENDEKPYLSGAFIITSLEESAPANEDATYSATFKNAGMPTLMDETGITEGTTTGASEV